MIKCWNICHQVLLREHRERLGWSIRDLEEARAAVNARKLREEKAAEEALARGEVVVPGGRGGGDDPHVTGMAAKSSPGVAGIRKQTLADIASGEVEDDEATAAEVSRLGETAAAAATDKSSENDKSLLLGTMRIHQQVG